MQKREVTKKQLAVIILLSIGMLAAAALLNQFSRPVKADKRNIKTDSGYAEGDRFAVVVSDTKTDTDA